MCLQYTYDFSCAADRLTGWTIINSTSYTANYSGNGNPDNYRERKSDFGLVCLQRQQAARRERHKQPDCRNRRGAHLRGRYADTYLKSTPSEKIKTAKRSQFNYKLYFRRIVKQWCAITRAKRQINIYLDGTRDFKRTGIT